jgi:hypothetical protein
VDTMVILMITIASRDVMTAAVMRVIIICEVVAIIIMVRVHHCILSIKFLFFMDFFSWNSLQIAVVMKDTTIMVIEVLITKINAGAEVVVEVAVDTRSDERARACRNCHLRVCFNLF